MAKRGIILMNLGSPDTTSVADLKKYLTQFLMDERVIDKPLWLRTLLVKGIIVPFRAAKSAEAYKTIWTKEGSPLIVFSQLLQKELAQKIDLPITLSMRYGHPYPKEAFDTLLQQCPDLDEVILVPLYPHYAMSSFETAVEYMKAAHAQYGYTFKLKTVTPFYNHPAYIHALAESMRPHLQDEYDQLLFSYHGIPERHIYKTDKSHSTHNLSSTEYCCQNEAAQATCYRHQVMETTRLVAAQLGLEKSKWQISFQSRLGRDPWLQPNTQVRLPQLPQEGIKKLKIVSPAFVSDCLETLEELAIRGKEDFLKNGGEQYQYIPCMNTQPLWIDAITQIINDTIAK